MIPSNAPANAAPPKALLAEDDALIRDIVAQYLARLGFDVLEAANGREAVDIIDRLENERLELVVTDLLMPGLGGEAVVQEAQLRRACERFLIISGFSQQTLRLSASVSDAALYLEKPFTFASFESKLEELYRHSPNGAS